MAFDKDYLTLVGPDGNTKSGKQWRYFSEDTGAQIQVATYFNDASDLLDIGDTIDCFEIADLTADPLVVDGASTVIVLTNVAGVVDVTNATAFTVTDSD